MEIVESLLKVIDSEAIYSMAKEAVISWAAEDSKNRDMLVTSELTFKSHKFCFKSSSLDYPFFESTYQFVKEDEELGLYRIFTSLQGEAVDDYYEIY
ncbi:MAG: hypothetical protein ACJAR3_002219 [Roseivirga sp.]